jgi:protein TonB
MRIFPFGVLLVVACMAGAPASAQKAAKPPEPVEADKIFQKVEIESGTSYADWTRYMSKHAKLPDKGYDSIPRELYNVLVKFVVNVDGKLSDVRIDRDPGYGLGDLALKIFNGYKGKWIPANQCGRLVKAYKTQVISFDLRSPE